MSGGLQQGIASAAELFQAAAVDQVGWDDALDALARATDSIGAQLIGFGNQAFVPFNLMTGVPPETSEAFLAAGGGDPSVNSRVRIGAQAGQLEVLDEASFTTASDMRRNGEYAHWIETYDMHHTCLTNLVKSSEGLVGLALLRGARQGNVTNDQKRAFTAIARSAHSAVRMQMSLEAQGAALLSGAMEAVRAAAFVCDRKGGIRTMTTSAEAVLRDGDVLCLEQGTLTAAYQADRLGFEGALRAVAQGALPGASLGVRRLGSADRVHIEIAHLQAARTPSFEPWTLVVVKAASLDEARVARVCRLIYGLNASEAAIAAQLGFGRAPAAIARDRQVSIGTVRTQIRQIYSKVGVTSQLELAARLSRL